MSKRYKSCGAEWLQFGSCCDPYDLVTLVNFENSTIRHSNNVIKDRVGKIRDGILADPSIEDSIKDEARDITEGFAQRADECWDTIFQIRSSALCSMCSGRSQVFFNDDGLILTASDTCRRAVDSCEDFFMTLSDLDDLLERFLKPLLRQVRLRTSTSWTTLKNLNSSWTILRQSRPPQELLDAFREYDAHAHDQSRWGLHSAKVCSMFLNIRKAPYIFLADRFSILRTGKISLRYKYKLYNIKSIQILEKYDALFDKLNAKVRALQSQKASREVIGKA